MGFPFFLFKLLYSIRVLGGNPLHSWNPVMTGNTTSLDYWLNWRFFLCATWVISSMIVASVLIWRYEGLDQQQETAESQQQQQQRQKKETVGTLYDDDSWRPCLKHIHPAWLLAFRLTAFFVLSVLLIVYISIEGIQTFFYYTQWTFALVVIYFGIGSLLSIYGCRQFCKEVNGIRVGRLRVDEEQRSTYVAPVNINTSSEASGRSKRPVSQEEHRLCHTAGIWGYLFQFIYQTSAGAVVLTDFVFWVFLVPFLEMKEYNLNLLMIIMHSVNAVFLLGDVAINSLRFPVFRIAYFLLCTGIYVFFQWIVHACVSFWWPYPFLDLSSQYSPVWYLSVALLHLPCYAIFFLIIKTKHWLLSRFFPYSYLL